MPALTFDVLDLGTLPGKDAAYAYDINNAGQVAGYSSQLGVDNSSLAFRYTPGVGLENLGTLGGAYSLGLDINEAGQVSGKTADATGKHRSFRWTSGSGMLDIGDLGTNAGVYAEGINNNGEVTGYSFYFGMQVAFTYSDTTGIRIVGPAPSSERTALGYDINDTGRVVGYTYPNNAFRTGDNGVGTGYLGTLPGGTTSWAYAINNANQVTGYSTVAGGATHAFRFTDGVPMLDLGTLGGNWASGYDLDSAGNVVGSARTAAGVDHAFYWSPATGMLDLNTLIAPDSGWVLTVARGLNDAGQIVGDGFWNGQPRGFVLTPFSGEDTAPPVAVEQADDITSRGAATYTFTVIYFDRTAVAAASVGAGDIRVTGPNGFNQLATFVSVAPAGDGVHLVATYRINAPGGSWNGSDYGSYSVAIQANQIRDTLGHYTPAGVLGTFEAAIDLVPVVSVSGPPQGFATQPITFTLQATGSYPHSPSDVFTFQLDWNNDGTVDEAFDGTTGSQIAHIFGTSGSYTVSVTARDPHGLTSSPATASILVNPAPVYQAWQAAPPFPIGSTGRTFAAGVNYHGTLAALGGRPFSPDADLNAAAHLLLPGATAWQQGPWLEGPIERQGLGIDQLDRIIVFGGREPFGGPGGSYVYDLTAGPGDHIDDLPGPNDNVATATDDQHWVYAIGGGVGAYAGSANPNSTMVRRYNAYEDQWEQLAPLPAGRAEAAAVYDGRGHILVIGGFDALGNSRTATVFQYDIASNSWSTTAVPNLPAGRSALRAVLGADGLIYALGGASGGPSGYTATRTVYIYNPDTGVWTTGANMITARTHFAAALSDDGWIYAMGGSNVGTGTSLVERIYTVPPTPAVQVKDDGDPGFSATGGFYPYSGQGHAGDVTFAGPGDGSEQASWTFTGLTTGLYRVSVTWSEHPNRATDAPFAVYDGATLIGTALVSQEQAPHHFTVNGTSWFSLGGPFQISSGTLVVRLHNNANEYVIADAIRVERLSSSPVQIKDDGDAGFGSTSGFFAYPGQGYGGDVRFAAAGLGTESASWIFTGLEAGLYRVSVTWSEHSNRATDAAFTVLDGASELATALVNQEQAPGDFSLNGVFWEDLGNGVYSISGDTLTVRLSDLADEYVIADAVRIERLA